MIYFDKNKICIKTYYDNINSMKIGLIQNLLYQNIDKIHFPF